MIRVCESKSLSCFVLPCLMSGAAGAAPIESTPASAQQLAMEGAVSAQVNGATSMAINPAGMAFIDPAGQESGEFVLTGGQPKPATENKREDSFGIFWAKRYTKWAFGLGLYDTNYLEISYLESDGLTQSTAALEGYDISANLALAPSERMKLGATFKVASIQTVDKRGKVRDEDGKYHFSIGSVFKVLDTTFDYANSSGQFLWNVGGVYQPESKQKPFEDNRNHALRDRAITAQPKSMTLASNISVGWIFDAVSLQLNLNADMEKQEYSEMSDLLLETAEARDVQLTKKMAGVELLIGAAESANTLILRAGLSDQTSNFTGLLEKQAISAGVGLVSGNMALDLAAQTTQGNANEDEDSFLMLELGVQF